MATSDEDNYLTFEDAFEDVQTRFLTDLSDVDLQTAHVVFFRIEQAWWYYDDLICDVHPECNLPRFASLKPFSKKLFEFSPLLPNVTEFPSMWADYAHYRSQIPNYGCILLNEECSKFILCRVWMSHLYTFPAGKINPGEDGPTAAARETYEETGFDPSARRGTTAKWLQQDPSKMTWNTTLSESDALTVKDNNGKRRTVYVVVGVPETFPFQPVVRKEVSEVAWFSIDHFPKDTYAVLPFLGPLKEWMRNNKKGPGSSSTKERPVPQPNPQEARTLCLRERIKRRVALKTNNAETSKRRKCK